MASLVRVRRRELKRGFLSSEALSIASGACHGESRLLVTLSQIDKGGLGPTEKQPDETRSAKQQNTPGQLTTCAMLLRRGHFTSAHERLGKWVSVWLNASVGYPISWENSGHQGRCLGSNVSRRRNGSAG